MQTLQPQSHSQGWVIQVWLAFTLSISMTGLGIAYLPVDNWVKGYMTMGLVFTVGSTISLAKTTRDLDEAKKLVARVDEARVERLLAKHDPLDPVNLK